MSRQAFTVRSTSPSQPALTFYVDGQVPTPDTAQMLVRYFESRFAQGVPFRAGQKVDVGGCLLRLFARPDGTLGVADFDPLTEEVSAAPPKVDSVHHTLTRVWMRVEVPRSYGFEPEFPATDATAIVCTDVETSLSALVLKRATPTPNTPDSGWFIGCTAGAGARSNEPAHDHNAREHLQRAYLGEVVSRYPWLDQFVALPIGTDVIVEMDKRVAVPVLWHGEGDAIEPREGTYVAALNAAAGL